ncbi:hypothetical protein SKAU_G00066960 [Synaphobranchus kaupii]|uniref:Uncharacterized protein n=1 Tax=Synaphobranchus kaupii TaxID=118154 RepID=A0A9Q1G6X7_SYNKA|nr:hypothetical protein SKAU_G00066960 [Synaphobranchus kaupii]
MVNEPIRETDLTGEDVRTARYPSPASCEEVDTLLLKEQQQQTIALQNLSHIPDEVKKLTTSMHAETYEGWPLESSNESLLLQG